ncbi:uncharacterized protein LOC135835398 [Planococcus citri]|uniref:uncharacterized protein LOC135835398 n=1 Tax=Planococcus citri TaxID=170843 RepID=UPI0031F9D129
MNKSFLLIFSTGLISIHLVSVIIASSTPSNQAQSDATSSTDHTLSQPPTDPSTETPPKTHQNSQNDDPLLIPSLTCILFEDFGCKTQCSIVEEIRGFKKTTGSCSDKVCSCLTVELTLSQLWNKKFESSQLLLEIEKDKDLYNEVYQKLRDPSRTPEQSDSDLESVLPKSMYEELVLKKVESKINLKPDPERLQVRVDELFKPMMENTLSSELAAIDYSKLLREYLENNKNNPSIQKVFRQIRETENAILEGILDEFLAKHKDIEENADLKNAEKRSQKVRQEDLTPRQVMTNIIINELIKRLGKPELPETEVDTDDRATMSPEN